MSDVVAQGQDAIMRTYAQFPVAFVSGHGRTLVDADGKEYLDFVAGIAVNALGYGDELLSAALKRVIDNGLLHCSNLYWNPYAVSAAQSLKQLSGMDKVFFCNSGAEANEAALKLARKFGHLDGGGRTEIITMEHSFHGRTYGAITATGQDKYHKNFDPLLPRIRYAVFNDFDSVLAQVNDDTCAIMVEPIQGEGGIIPADPEFLKALRTLCDERHILLMFDEVQCGMGRSGQPFAWQTYGVKPDVMTLAKALAGGVPAGAMIACGVAADILQPGDHAATFGGNLLAMSGACVMLERLAEGGLCEHVRSTSAYFIDALRGLQAKYPSLTVDVRGRGLMLGAQLTVPPRVVVDAAMERGLLVASAGYDVLRFVPPLTVTTDEIDRALAILDEVFSTLVSDGK
jgi:predicted acetylornithine/succinylornithine family transaminase